MASYQASHRLMILSLYRKMLRESLKFDSYMYREYFFRRTKEEFRDNSKETDPVKIKNFIEDARKNLLIIQRQAMIGRLYPSGKLIVENQTQFSDLNHQDDDDDEATKIHRNQFKNHLQNKNGDEEPDLVSNDR